MGLQDVRTWQSQDNAVQVRRVTPSFLGHRNLEHGPGRTYLAHYILVKALARRQNTILFTSERVMLFTSSGVFSGGQLDIDFGSYHGFGKAVGEPPLAIVDVTEDAAGPGPVDRMFFCVWIYPPSSRRHRDWMRKNGPELLVLDVLSAPLMVAM